MQTFAHPAVFRPVAARQPALMAAAAAVIAALLGLAVVVRGATDGVTFAAFLAYVVGAALLAVAVLAGYWALAINALRYEIAGDTLTIVWGLTRQVVPLAHIERLVRGRALGLPAVEGLSLPYVPCHVGRGRVRRLGTVLFYSTHRASDQILYLVTGDAAYGISPAEPQGMIRVLQRAVAEAGESAARQEVLRHPLAALPVWTDRVLLAGGAACALLALAAVGVVFARYTGIAPLTVIPFPDGKHVGDKRALLGIPLSAVALVLIDGAAALALHRPMRPVAYTLLFGGVFVQALLFVAALAAT